MISAEYKILERSQESVFFEKPSQVFIDERSMVSRRTLQKIEILIEGLRKRGPLVFLGEVRSKYYNPSLFKNSYAMVLGAKKLENEEFVYFMMCEDVTSDQTTFIREHKPSEIDQKIYRASYEIFRKCLFELYLPMRSHLDFSTSGMAYAKRLCSMLFKSILDEGKGKLLDNERFSINPKRKTQRAV